MNKFNLKLASTISTLLLSSVVFAAPLIDSDSTNLNFRLMQALKLANDPLIQNNGSTMSLVVGSQSVECQRSASQDVDCSFTGSSLVGDIGTNSQFAESMFKAIETYALANQATDGGVRRLQLSGNSIQVTLAEDDGTDQTDLFSSAHHDRITCNSTILFGQSIPDYSCDLEVTQNASSAEATTVYTTALQDANFAPILAADIQLFTNQNLSLRTVTLVKSLNPSLIIDAYYSGTGGNLAGRDLVLKAWRNSDGTLSVNTVAIDLDNQVPHHHLSPGVSGNN